MKEKLHIIASLYKVLSYRRYWPMKIVGSFVIKLQQFFSLRSVFSDSSASIFAKV